MSALEEDFRAIEVRRVQRCLDALVEAVTADVLGVPRPEAERLALIDGVRAALDRLATGEPPPAAADRHEGSLPVGTMLANSYAVRALIGIGGTAEVYQVRHRDLQTDFAVKILKAERAGDPLLVELFAAEARALAQLRHDGIVQAHALLRHGDGRPFMVLDLARGPTLAEVLRRGEPLDGEGLRAVAYRLATCLDALHAQGLVHGDLSPENVALVGGQEAAVLLDLGLAKAPGNEGIAFAGKWSSAAPEQLDGSPASPEADVYALGLLLTAAAAGAPLPLGHDRVTASAARQSLPLDGLPEALSTLVPRMLQVDPAARPKAFEVARAFERREGGWGTLLSAIETLDPGRAVERLRQLVPGSKIA